MNTPPGPFRIGIVVSTIAHKDQLEEFSSKQADEIILINKGLDEAVAAAQQLESEQGVEVILARRGTATLLRENLSVPVLTFSRDTFAILSTLREASIVGKRILFTAFREPIVGLSLADEIWGIEIVQRTYEDSNTLEEQVLWGKKNGCTVAVGGGLTLRYAHQHGLEGFELGFSKQMIETTLENARDVARSNRREHEDSRRYQAVIDSVSEGVISFDKNAVITTVNQSARQMLKVGDDGVKGYPVTNFLGETSAPVVLQANRPRIDLVEHIDGERFLFSHLPVTLGKNIIGGVSTFKRFSEVMKAENVVRRSLSKGLTARYHLDDIIHSSSSMQEVLDTAAHYAQTDSTVMIMGETGTGKELIAQGIHNSSKRRRQPFVSLNCAALPENLMESELFGYDEGAFTGSKTGGKTGLLELAHNGTIFLDEISETPLQVQVSLLRVLQEREIMRLGSDRRIPIDIRIITATNRDLIELIRENKFREDLYFRLNVLELPIPPLRERIECLPRLLDYFISRISRRQGGAQISIPVTSLSILMEYSWPGNIRQLENFIERLVVISGGAFSQDRFDRLVDQLFHFTAINNPEEQTHNAERIGLQSQNSLLENEEIIIRDTLQRTGYKRQQAAQSLGISRTTLWKKMKRYGILK